MNTLEVNTNTLATLYEQSPQAFDGITLDGKMLKFNGQEVDISEFNITELLADNNNFAASLDSLSPEDVFKVIKLHADLLGSNKGLKDDDASKKRMETIKQENPLMKNISIVQKNDQGIKREYINIVDSTGKDHLFPNDRNVNVFDIYDLLKIQYGDSVTPDQLIEAVYRKLYDVQLSTAEGLANKETTSEEFVNKLNRVNEPYKNSKTVDVVASQEHDIAIVSDKTDPTNHRVVTFDQNEFGDLVVNQHDQNVTGVDTVTQASTDAGVTDSSNDVNETADTEHEEFENDDKNVEAVLLTSQEFYALLNSSEELNAEERKNVDLYYAYLEDLLIYIDYLVPELKKMWYDFKTYVFELQYGDVHVPLTANQREAISRLEEMEKADDLSKDKHEPDKIEDGVKKLQRLKPVDNYGSSNDNAGMVSVIQVVAFIIGISFILTAITLYLLN